MRIDTRVTTIETVVSNRLACSKEAIIEFDKMHISNQIAAYYIKYDCDDLSHRNIL